MKILTDEEIKTLWASKCSYDIWCIEFARAIEAKILERIGEPVAHCWMEDGDVKAFAFNDIPQFKPTHSPNAVSTPLFAIKGVE